jgi:hypothetical protein
MFYGIGDGPYDINDAREELERIKRSVAANQNPIGPELFWLLYENVKQLENEIKIIKEQLKKETGNGS